MGFQRGTGKFAALDTYILGLQSEAIQALVRQIDIRDRLGKVIRAAEAESGAITPSREPFPGSMPEGNAPP
jgi:hypothetical protein